LDAVASTRCDALILDDESVSDTIPTIQVQTDDATVSHEATA
jgi:Fe-S cluster assembly scaffold protein SufB